MWKAINITLIVVVSGIAGTAGYHMVRMKVAADVYLDRLQGLTQEYEQLRTRYNDAIRKTAITELQVEDSKVSVVIRTAEGVIKTIPTPYDPKSEIHVDYVVIDGRIWLRRIYDSKTNPNNAQVIDPKLAQIDWDPNGREYGLIVYRPLAEGRWVVNTTANGALTLVRKPDGTETALAPPPAIRQFAELEKEVSDMVDEIGPRDVFKRIFGDE